MRTRKLVTALTTLSIALAITACSGKSNNGTDINTTTDSSISGSTESSSANTGTSMSTDELTERMNDLYQQENVLFSDHSDVWNKMFGFMSKDNTGENQEMEYADFLASTLEANKASFTEEELAVVSADIETIRGIEKEITELQNQISGAGAFDDGTSVKENSNPFPGFTGKDLEGNDVDDSIFSANAVTVVNFWFNGCKPCVAELSKLNELNETLKGMGGELIGINTETLDGNKSGIEEALTNGETFSEALLHSNIFSKMYSSWIAIGSKTGSMDEVMQHICTSCEDDTDARLSRFISVIEPAMVILLCIFIGFILVSFLLPLLGIISSIG